MLEPRSTHAHDMGTKERSFYVELGQRISEQRKTVGLTQVQLAEQLGIAQQTLAHYEGGVSRIAVETLAQVAQTLNTSVEVLLGTATTSKRAGKRGPQPKIAQQLERIQSLPAAEQRVISRVIDSMLAAHQ